MELKIFLTNLGKYNEGSLVGDWFTLPVDIDEALEQIGVGEDTEYEEYFITDYEAPFKIGEHASIDHLNYLAEKLEDSDIEDEDIDLLMEHYSDFESMLDAYDDGEITIYRNYSAEQFAEEYVEETGMLDEVPKSLQPYIDYESLGRDMVIGGDIYEVSGGVLMIAE